MTLCPRTSKIARSIRSGKIASLEVTICDFKLLHPDFQRFRCVAPRFGGWPRRRSWGSAIPRSGTCRPLSASASSARLMWTPAEASLREIADAEEPPSAPARRFRTVVSRFFVPKVLSCAPPKPAEFSALPDLLAR